jgi:hypothetical protein
MCGCQGATGAMLLVRRNFDAAVADRRAVAFWFASVRLLESTPCSPVLRPAVLRSTDEIKADGGDGLGDLGGESLERPAFAGVRRSKLARKRSWPEAEPAVLGAATGSWRR